MKHTFLWLPMLAIMLVGAGCTAEPEPDTPTAQPTPTVVIEPDVVDDSEATEVTNEEPSDNLEASVEVSVESTGPTQIGNRDLYVATKIGTTTTVYSENTQTTDRTELFSFEEGFAFEPDSRNIFREQPAAVDYSPVRNEFVYVNENEVYTYDAATGYSEALLTITGSKGEIDLIDQPIWSIDGMPEQSLKIFAVNYSPTGNHVRLSVSFYEGMQHVILDLENKTLTPLAAYSGVETDWSDDGKHIVAVGSLYANVNGLHVALDGDFSNTKNLFEGQEFISVESAVWLEDNTLLVSYQDRSEDGGEFDEYPYYIAHMDTDGVFLGPVEQFAGKPEFVIGTGNTGYFMYTKTNEQTEFASMNTNDYTINTIVGGGEAELLDVDTTRQLVVQASSARIEEDNDNKYIENLAVYSISGQHLYQPRSAVYGSLSFLGWAPKSDK